MQRKTDITVILDRSGSMRSCKESMEAALNSYIADQRNLPGPCNFTLVKFDDQYEMSAVCDIRTTENIVIDPRGNTALRDAMGRTINSIGERLANTPEHERPDRVLIVVVTDGIENASREFSHYQVQRMVEHQKEKYSWEFLYLGAGQDSIKNASDLGIGAKNAINFVSIGRSSRGSGFASQALSMATKAFRENEEKTSGGILEKFELCSARSLDDSYKSAYGSVGAVHNTVLEEDEQQVTANVAQP
jgi:hypothetical protein